MLSAMIGGFGSSSFTAFRVVNSRLDTMREMFLRQPEVARDVTYMRNNIGKVESLDDLLDDPRLWNNIASTYGLEENAFAKGFFKKLLTEDSSDKNALVNRMVDPRYKELVKDLEIDKKGMANFKDAAWVEKFIDSHVTRRFEVEAGAANPAIESALYFQRKAPEITSFYNLLSDKKIYEVVRAAAGLPSEFSRLDVDKQAEILKGKFKLEDFKDPAKVAKMIDRHLALSDAENIAAGGGLGGSPNGIALMTMPTAPMTGFGPIVSIDPTLLLRK